MKPTIKKVQPVKVVAPFLNSQSESPVPLDALTDQEKVSDLCFLKGTVHQIAKPYLSINNCTFKQQIFSECQFKSAQLTDVRFENCDLSNVSFAGTTFYRVDLYLAIAGNRFPGSHPQSCFNGSLLRTIHQSLHGKNANSPFQPLQFPKRQPEWQQTDAGSFWYLRIVRSRLFAHFTQRYRPEKL